MRTSLLLLSSIALGFAPALAQIPRANAEFKPVLQIGEELGPPEYTFARISSLAVGPDGQIYVADSQEHAVKVYSPSGTFLRSFGRKGGGPGEFSSLSYLRVHEGKLTGIDVLQKREITFSTSGEHIQTRRLGSLAGGADVLAGMRGRVLVGIHHGVWRPGFPLPQFVLVIGKERSERVDTVLTAPSGHAYFHKDGGPPFGGLVDTGRGGDWELAGDSLLVILDGMRGTLTKYIARDSFVLRAPSIDLGLRPQPLNEYTLAKIRTATEHVQRRNGRVEAEVPHLASAATKLVLGERGAIWVQEGQSEVDWLVLPAGTDRPLRIRMPEGFNLMRASGPLLYGQARTELDVPVVQIYRLHGVGLEAKDLG